MLKKPKLKDIEKGDTFAYEIVNEEEFKGRYLILWESGIYDERCRSSRLMRIKITKDNKLPENEEEFQKLEDIISTITFMEARFFPFSGTDTIDNQIKERSKIDVDSDEFGYLYTYTTRVNYFRNLYRYLLYLGNYEINNDMKPKEFIPFHPINIGPVWANKNDLYSFEKYCLINYKEYNLRRSELFNYTPTQRKAREKEIDMVIKIGKKFE